MASEEQVRKYLAYWFQLGKQVVIKNGDEKLLPQPIYKGDRYSLEFEACWQRITDPKSGVCYLEGTNESIEELLTSKWEILLCCRCTMPIPTATLGMPPDNCPCIDLPSWPNTAVPQPRSSVESQNHLRTISNRLLKGKREEEIGEPTLVPDPELAQCLLEFPRCPCPKNSEAVI